MTRWSTALTEAGINNPPLRQDYEAQRRLVRRFKLQEFLALRLLLPAHLQPSVIAAVAFMHETDRRIDVGEVATRRDALHSWGRQVGEAVEHGTSDRPVLRALADTAERHPQLSAYVQKFLDGARLEAGWTGFEEESDFQAYVDAYSHPAFMLTASLVAPTAQAEQAEAFERGCRTLIEAMQRADFLADLSEDASQSRIGIPRAELAHFGLTVDDLLSPSPTSAPALEQLVQAQARAVSVGLSACRDLPDLVAVENQPFLRAFIRVQELQLEDVQRRGGKLLHEEAGASKPAALGVLLQHYLAARKQRRQ
ncbi:phytoene/squalene synthase family protein [Streptomyces violens]|uniref:phytoene/squalene synthase family protein n=1 Tax=Streptomyces violens TaxID=66377 RepID=UPI0004BF103E|nr:squalene/phytoene synthase family protein [Streptomyces violens]